jgi:hypothetical protein
MVPSRLRVTGFDESSVYFRTVDDEDVFVEWRDLPITESMSSSGLKEASDRIRKQRRNTVREALETLEQMLHDVQGQEHERELQEVYSRVETLW